MLFSKSVWSLYTIGDKRSIALLKKAVLVPKKKSIKNPTDINEPLLSISKVHVCFIQEDLVWNTVSFVFAQN